MKVVALDTNALVVWASCEATDAFLLRLGALAKPKDIRLLIPTPVVAEFLVKSGGAGWLDGLRNRSNVVIVGFDMRAAVECAELDRAVRASTGRKQGSSRKPWQAIKIDRQIVAIALTHRADLIITGDEGLRQCAIDCGLQGLDLDDLPRSDDEIQGQLDL